MYQPEALHPGDIILVAGQSRLDRIIRWATTSPFSHAALVDHGRLIEAAWPTVRTAPLDEYAKDGWAYTVSASDEQRRRAILAARSRIGQPYGLEELLLDGARFILHVLVRVKPTYLTCSHLVVWAYASAGVVLTYAPYPAPSDLAYSPLLLGPRPWMS